MDSTVSSWKTNLLLSSRTPRHFWVFALLLTLILHFLIIWLLSDWLHQKPKKPQFLRVEWLPPPQKPVLKKTKAQIPIPVPEETKEPDKLNDLIQKEPAEKLSMKMLKTAKKNPDSEKSEISQGLPSEPAGIQKTPEKPLNSKEDLSKSSPDSIRSQTESPKESGEENELEESLAFFSPQALEDEFEEVAQKKPEVGKLEPLPENWMLRKTVPQSEEKSNSPGLRSLIQNAWLSEIPGEDQEGPPPPPGSPGASRQGSGFFTLSSYDWPYESYMGRWAKALVYHWRNNPPMDYVSRLHPQGGEVFVLVSLNRSGELNTYEVTQIHRASREMEQSVLDAVLSSSQLPPLPEDHEEDLLQVHFRFIYPPLRVKKI